MRSRLWDGSIRVYVHVYYMRIHLPTTLQFTYHCLTLPWIQIFHQGCSSSDHQCKHSSSWDEWKSESTVHPVCKVHFRSFSVRVLQCFECQEY